MDINEFWTLNASATDVVQNNSINFSTAWKRNCFAQNNVLSVTQNTFSFYATGLYNLYGELTCNDYWGVTSVGLWENDQGGKFVSKWTAPQTGSPSLTFSLPVEVLHKSANTYTIVVTTRRTPLWAPSIPPFSLVANTMIGIEYFGSATGTKNQEAVYRQHGILNKFDSASFSMGSTYINLMTSTRTYGSSEYISITPEGKYKFSNPANYRISAYIETTDAFVSSITVTTSDNTNPAVPVASMRLPLGISSGYSIDLLVDAQNNFSTNVFQVVIGLTSSYVNQTSTTLTDNTYITVVGVSANSPQLNYSYVDSVGTYLIQSAELKIGGQSIQTLTGEAIEIYNDLFVQQENQPGLALLTGKMDNSWVYTIPGFTGRTYYINLPFFFYGNAELSLPICSLGSQDLEVYVTFNNFQGLTTLPNQIPTPENIDVSMIVDYAYITEPEIRWFNNHRQDYIITQHQYFTFSMNESLTFDLRGLAGPVREIYFVIQDQTSGPYVYSTDPGIGLKTQGQWNIIF
jgi:hypothetical protein